MPKLQTENEMLEHVLQAISPLTDMETLPADQQILGRISSASIISPLSLPLADTSAMDGFALRRADIPGTLPICGFAAAGQPISEPVSTGCCVRIATGAWVPPGLDLVVPMEDVKEDKDQVTFTQLQSSDDHIRKRGEDLGTGTTILNRGTKISARHIALLRSLGIDRAKVLRRPVIGVLATGDELRVPGESLTPGTCYESNQSMISALLQHHGFCCLDLGLCRDDPDELRATLVHGTVTCDAIITIGGASVGDRDLVKEIIAELGQLRSWQVAIKPGKPFVLGTIADKPLLGLPGNPASAYVTFLLLVLPGLWHLAGLDPRPQLPQVKANLATEIKKAPGRAEYCRGLLERDSSGNLTAKLAGSQSSGAVNVLAHANCLIKLPLATTRVSAGELVEVIPLDFLA